MKKSFVFGVAAPEYNFIGREKETSRLITNFESGVNTILISPRRWGKTSLVSHVCGKMRDNSDVLIVRLDIFSCRSEYDFYNQFAAAVLKQTATKKDQWLENAREFLVRLSPMISFRPDPSTDFNLSLGITPKTHTPEEILELPETIARKRGKRIVVCIDEFQQISELPDAKTIQRKLRTVWQHQELTSYCLYGSKKHLMSMMFQSRDHAFYHFGDVLFLGKIPTEEWVKYICQHFADNNKTISEELASKICGLVDNHSSYVQQLSWNVINMTEDGESVTDDIVDAALDDLINVNESLFLQQIAPLTNYQINFLRALADGVTIGFGEKNIRENYSLGAPSNIKRLKDSLENRELISVEGKTVTLTDPVFLLWLCRTL